MTYTEFVKSRFKYGDAILTSANADAFGLLHAAVGIVGELYEYSISNSAENAREELGDVVFYVHAAAQAIGIVTLDEPTPMDSDAMPGHSGITMSLDCAMHAAFKLLDIAKKAAFYNKEPIKRIAKVELCNIIECVVTLAAVHRTTLTQLIDREPRKARNALPVRLQR